MEKNPSPDPPFISHYAIIQGEMGLFLTFSVFELQRGYLYQNGVEFRQKVIGACLNLFWGHLHYFSGGILTFPLLSDMYASAPIAERAISDVSCLPSEEILPDSGVPDSEVPDSGVPGVPDNKVLDVCDESEGIGCL